MHGWKHMVELLELVDRPKTLGFQADMAHTMLYTMGYNSPRIAGCSRRTTTWSDPDVLTNALSPGSPTLCALGTIDFHVAQNDGTVKGSGSHDKTGRHCPPDDPNGKMTS